MSISGGYYKAIERAASAGMSTCQIFTKNNNQWRAKPITDQESRRFRDTLRDCDIILPLSHASYLINLAAPNEELRKKSVDAFVVELRRAEQLGIPHVVLHPGSFTSSSEREGVDRIIRSLDEIHSQTEDIAAQCLLENTAGQGSNLGWKFEQLAAMIEGVQHPERLGVCFDTCHAVAAGYPLQSKEEYDATMQQFEAAVGTSLIKAFHLNDSKRELGSRVDRHEHIGQGALGLDPFRWLLNDSRFRAIPMYLETPKGETDADEDWDVVNLRTLRGLLEG